MFSISLSVLRWHLLNPSGFSVRTVSVLPVRRGFGHSRWRCVCGTRFTTWSASSVLPARSTSAWVTATCSSTQTLCASRTSLSGPNSTTTTWFSRICCSTRRSVTLPLPTGFKGNKPLIDRLFVQALSYIIPFIWNDLNTKGEATSLHCSLLETNEDCTSNNRKLFI